MRLFRTGHDEIMMLVVTGRERTASEFAELMAAAAGWRYDAWHRVPNAFHHAKTEQMLTEARVILPGAQALFGFQLAIVLTRSFEQLPRASRIHACRKPFPGRHRRGAAHGSGRLSQDCLRRRGLGGHAPGR